MPEGDVVVPIGHAADRREGRDLTCGLGRVGRAIVQAGAADTHVPFSPPPEEFVLPNEAKILQALQS